MPAELTIYAAAEIRAALLARLDAEAAQPAASFTVDAAATGDVDAAGVQLLVALERLLASRGRRLELVEATQPLVRACRALGVANLVEAPL